MNAQEKAQERLRRLLDGERERLRSTLPPDRWATIAALTRARDRLHLATMGLPLDTMPPDTSLETRARGRLGSIGWNSALELCLTAPTGALDPEGGQAETALDGWADRMLMECGRLGEAEQALAWCETGYLQLQDGGGDTFDAWATTKRMPAEWRERQDFAWWSAALARQYEPERQALLRSRPDRPQGLLPSADDDLLLDTYTTATPGDVFYQRLGLLEAGRMACQHSYPPDAAVGGHAFRLYGAVLAHLIGWMLQRLDRRTPTESGAGAATDPGSLGAMRSEAAVVNALAAALGVDAAVAREVLGCFMLDRENAAYHAALPGAAPPPCVRVDDEHLVWSVAGLLEEPFIFLTRELRRRDAEGYHNTAHLREGVFRRDLYRLFGDKRFVTSAGRVELKREGGDARTDLDAVIFDRKTGTLGVFELKAQDPFARTARERLRQRDNFYHANAQVAVALHWLQRHGPDALLARVDPATAKRFKAQRVHVFVLGRYLAHFADGPEPDRRAAWGTWPQALRLAGERPYGSADANPLSALFHGLVRDTPLSGPATGQEVREIPLGAGRVRVYPSFARYRRGGEGAEGAWSSTARA